MKELPNVTLLAVSSIEIPDTIKALQISSEHLKFAEIVLVSHEKPINLPDNIVFKYYPKMNNITEFNNFCCKDFHKYFETSHCMLVQFHGYIIRPELWDDGWLQYDWIGAPWAYRDDSYITHDGEHVRQGNGGVRLQSKRFAEMPSKYNLPLNHDRGFYNEDGNYCVYYRRLFKELGINYADVNVASKFAFENNIPENQNILPFAFHKFRR